MNRNKIRVISKIFLVIFIIVVVLIIIIGTPYVLHCIFNNKVRDILISYLGSIYGGIFTLVGVIITINYEKNKSIKENEKIYKPLIKLESGKITDDLEMNTELSILPDTNIYKKGISFANVYLRLKNVGRGEMLNITLSDVSVEGVKTKYNSNLEGLFTGPYNFSEISVNDYIDITIGLPNPEFIDNEFEEIYSISFKIEFNDCLEYTRYIYKLSFCISNSNNKNYNIYNCKIIRIDNLRKK